MFFFLEKIEYLYCCLEGISLSTCTWLGWGLYKPWFFAYKFLPVDISPYSLLASLVLYFLS